MASIFVKSYHITDCGALTLDNGDVSAPSGTTFGQTTFLYCNHGYVLQGEPYIICEHGPNWSYNSTCLRGEGVLIKQRLVHCSPVLKKDKFKKTFRSKTCSFLR